jgi:hypothetical protein
MMARKPAKLRRTLIPIDQPTDFFAGVTVEFELITFPLSHQDTISAYWDQMAK